MGKNNLMNLSKVFREPFFHFFIFGLLLYIYYNLVTDESSQVNKKIIALTSYDSDYIKSSFEKLWHREPRKAELNALIQEHYNEQILLDEALVLELEKTDSVIRRRLIEKMQHIMTNTISLEEPTEVVLETYYKKHLEAYKKRDRISFSHVYYKALNTKQIHQVNILFTSLKIEPKNAHLFGDDFVAGNQIVDINHSACKTQFGNYFTREIYKLMPKQWHGPIRSKLGMHFVYINEVYATQPYTFDEVEYRVYQDYLRDRKKQAYEDAFKKISQQYELKRE